MVHTYSSLLYEVVDFAFIFFLFQSNVLCCRIEKEKSGLASEVTNLTQLLDHHTKQQVSRELGRTIHAATYSSSSSYCRHQGIQLLSTTGTTVYNHACSTCLSMTRLSIQRTRRCFCRAAIRYLLHGCHDRQLASCNLLAATSKSQFQY